MKNVLFTALLSAVAAATTWAQTPEPRPLVVSEMPVLNRLPDQAKPAAPAVPAAPAAPPRAVAPAAPAAPTAQAPVPAPARTQPAAPRSNPNVRFDVTITDTGGVKPVTKTLSLTVGSNNNSGSIRNIARVPASTPPPGTDLSMVGAVPLNVDVSRVTWVEENGVRASVTVVYQPYIPEAKSQPGEIQASAQTIFYDGRRTQIMVAADPISDRKTTIEVTATILK